MTAQSQEPTLARRLGPFDATMIVMGGIIGAGIFVNPSVVARQVHTPALVLGAWIIGGAIALIGAFVYAELAVLRPRVGGQYAYLARRLSSDCRISLWLDAAARRADRRHGRRGDHFRPLFPRADWSRRSGASRRRAHARHSDDRQLSRRPRRKQRPERADAHQARRDRAAHRRRVHSRHAGAIDDLRCTERTPAAPLALRPRWCRCCSRTAVGRPRASSAARCAIRAATCRVDLLIGVIGVIVLYLAVTFVCLRVLGVDGLAQTSTPGVRGHASGPRRSRRAIDRARHRDLDGRVSQSEYSHGAARVLRDGARWRVLSAVGRARSSLARPGRRDRAARRVGRDHRADGQVRSDPQLRRVDRRAVLRI